MGFLGKSFLGKIFDRSSLFIAAPKVAMNPHAPQRTTHKTMNGPGVTAVPAAMPMGAGLQSDLLSGLNVTTAQ